MSTKSATNGQRTTSIPPDAKPDFLRPGIRCALEMMLAGGFVLLVGLPAENAVYIGAVVTLALVVMVVVLFWAVNRQIEQWMNTALYEESDQLRQQQRSERG